MMVVVTRLRSLRPLLLFFLASFVWEATGQAIQTRGRESRAGRRGMAGMMGVKTSNPTLSPGEKNPPVSAAPATSKSPTTGTPSTSFPSAQSPTIVLIPLPSHTDLPSTSKASAPSQVPEPTTTTGLSPIVASPLMLLPLTPVAPIDTFLPPFLLTSPVTNIPVPAPMPMPMQGGGTGELTLPTTGLPLDPSLGAPSQQPFFLVASPFSIAPVVSSPAYTNPADYPPVPGIPPSSFFAPTPPPNRLGSPVSFPEFGIPSFDLVPGCFSGSTTVMVQHDQGCHNVAMRDLKIGDRIAVGNGVYETVYSFGHYLVKSHDPFQLLEIKTSSHRSTSHSKNKHVQSEERHYKSTLQVTHSHLIFLVSSTSPSAGRDDDQNTDSSDDVKMTAVPASSIQVGDYLWLDGYNTNKSGHTVRVDSITPRIMVNEGLYAPFTPSGKLLVNGGLLVSSYIGFYGSSALDMTLGADSSRTKITLTLTFQWLSHSFEFPHRVICYYLASCPMESYDEKGISTWMTLPLNMATTWLMPLAEEEQGCTANKNDYIYFDIDHVYSSINSIVRSVLWILLVSLLVLFNMMEVIVFQPFVFKSMTMTTTAVMMMMTIMMIGWIVLQNKHGEGGRKKIKHSG